MRNFSDYLEAKKKQYDDIFDESELAKEFIPYFENGYRIEVSINGVVMRGRVGVTTGWRPVFLLMLRRNSHGSSWILKHSDKALRVVSK